MNQHNKNFECLKFFKRFDGFGSNIQFNIKNDSNYKSILGGIISIIYIILCIAFVINNFLEFAGRGNMTLMYTNKILPSTPINLTDMKFTFSIGLIYDSNGLSALSKYSEYLDFNVSFVKFDGFADKAQIIKVPIRVSRCKISDFFIDYHNFTHKMFEDLELHNTFCPDQSEMKINNITGLTTDDIFHYYEATISIRKDKLDKISELDQTMTINPVKVAVYLINTGLDFDEISNPIRRYIEGLDYYVETEKYRKLYLQLSKLSFSSDENILYNNPQEKNSIILENLNLDEITKFNRYYPDDKDSLNLFSIYFNVSNKIIICKRTYQKLTDYIADMTGILSQVVLILIFIMGYVNNIAARQKILHRIMKFRGNKNYDRELFLNIFSEKLVKISDRETLLNNPFRFKQTMTIKNRKSIINQDSSPTTSLKKLNLSVTSNLNLNLNPSNELVKFYKMSSCSILLSAVICCNKKWNKNKSLIGKGDEKLNHYLDIFTYFKKMTELDYLKYLILNNEQVTLFNFITSPNFSKNKLNSEIKSYFDEEYKKKILLHKDEICKLNECYDKLLNSEKLTSFDSKLITLFMSELEALKND